MDISKIISRYKFWNNRYENNGDIMENDIRNKGNLIYTRDFNG